MRQRPAVAEGVPGNAVFLVGFMGAGKTSVGRALAKRLNWIFEDLDDRIEQREGRTIAEIFDAFGEPAFRQAEHAALLQLLDEAGSGTGKVIAAGGGTFAQPDSHRMLQASGVMTVFLDASLPELWARCARQGSGAKRPLQGSQNVFRELHAKRLPYYRTASLRVDATGKQVEAIANEIVEKLGLKKIVTRTGQGGPK